MPRTREFDEDEVLTAVMHEFRKNGYNEVSIKSLEQATGLTVGSFYNSFGGKKQLFMKALEHYNRNVVEWRIQKYLHLKTHPEGLRLLFLSLLEEPDNGTNGCLLTNSAVEFGAKENFAKSGIQTGLDLFQEAFYSVLGRYADEQEVTMPEKKRKKNSLKLLALYQGILVLIRSGHPKQELAALIETEIEQLLGDYHD